MKNKKIMMAIVAILFLSSALWYWYATNSQQQTLTLYGNVDIREVQLAFRVGGRLESVNVDEGTAVKAGDVLAQLDVEPLQNNLYVAAANLSSIKARNTLLHKGYRSEDIAQARASLDAGKAALNEAERELKRQKALIATGAVAQQTLEQSLSKRDQAQAQVKVNQQQLRLLTKGFRVEEIEESDGLLKSAQANLDQAKLALADATLTAPSNGMIITRAVEPGSMLNAGATTLTLSLVNPVWVRAYVNEPELGRVPSGTQVRLQTDSRPDKPYHGQVGFVSPTAEFTPKSVETTDLRTALVYRMRIVVTDPDAALRQGMPVTVTVQP